MEMRKVLCVVMSVAMLAGCAGNGNKADSIIIGNIITMNEAQPLAGAMTVKDGRIQFVGSEQEARAYCGSKTVIMDYGSNYVYPGFLEAHAHGAGAGLRMAGMANLDSGNTIEEYVQIMKQWVADHPDRAYYGGSGWKPWAISEPTREQLDAICPDKPMMLGSVDGHSMWVNSCLLADQKIDKEYAAKMGTAQVHVDAQGNPTGLLTEGAANALLAAYSPSADEFKDYILAWQDFAFSNGYTGATEAGVELAGESVQDAYVALADEGKLKLRTFAYHLVGDKSDAPEADVAKAVENARNLNSDYYKVIGLKVFIDGVIEAHTGWMLNDYLDDPGYHGLERYSNHDIAVRLIEEASRNGMSVHAHTIGNGAVRFMMDALAQAEDNTGNLDQRNILVHLQAVDPYDIGRMAKYKVIAGTAPLWTPKSPSIFKQEVDYVGLEQSEKAYPIKSFIDAGVVNVSHTDIPVSPEMSVPMTFVRGELRANLNDVAGTQRGPQEAVSRMDIMKSLTTNVAFLWRAEDDLGSLEAGKIANATVYDKDFLNDPAEEVAGAILVATIVDGNVVYSK